MYSNRLKTIEDFGKVFNKGTFGLYVATLTPLDLNKYPRDKQRVDCSADEYDRYKGKAFKLTIYQNAASGMNYYNLVKAECEREGITFSKEEFTAAFPNQESYCEGDNFIMTKVNGSQKYLRLYKGRKPTKKVEIILIGRRFATDEELSDIKRYEKPKHQCLKQLNLGIKNLIEVRNIKVENVVMLAQGENVWLSPLGEFIDLNKLNSLHYE